MNHHTQLNGRSARLYSVSRCVGYTLPRFNAGSGHVMTVTGGIFRCIHTNQETRT